MYIWTRVTILFYVIIPDNSQHKQDVISIANIYTYSKTRVPMVTRVSIDFNVIIPDTLHHINKMSPPVPITPQLAPQYGTWDCQHN